MNAWLKRCVFNLDLNRESVSLYLELLTEVCENLFGFETHTKSFL